MEFNFDDIKEFYEAKYQKFGYSPKALGCDKGKQYVRFDVLTAAFDCTHKKILDIGCGFGDLAMYLAEQNCKSNYTGIDIVSSFIEEAKRRHSDCEFLLQDFLKFEPKETFDVAFMSGAINLKIEGVDQYELLEKVVDKALKMSKEGIAFDFLSDKVDYTLEHAFHYAPERVLSIAYKYSRNVVLRNDYMPFEFALYI